MRTARYAARRMLAIANALCGMSREAVAEAAGMDGQTLRDLVIRYNVHGRGGLMDRRAMDARQPSTLKSWSPCRCASQLSWADRKAAGLTARLLRYGGEEGIKLPETTGIAFSTAVARSG